MMSVFMISICLEISLFPVFSTGVGAIVLVDCVFLLAWLAKKEDFLDVTDKKRCKWNFKKMEAKNHVRSITI